MAEKMWGDEEFWGLGYDWDPDWVLTEKQIELRTKLIGLCENEMRANAKRSDDELLYPNRNFEILGENGFLDCPLRLRLDGDVLRDAHGSGQHDHAAPNA